MFGIVPKKYFYNSVREEKRKYHFSNNTSLLDASNNTHTCELRNYIKITLQFIIITLFIFILGQSYVTNALNLHLNYTQFS